MLTWTEWSSPRRFVVLLVAALATRAPVFLHPFLNGDEATYTALANAMLDGRWLYAGAVDHKPPFIYATYAAILAVCGRYSLHAVHVVSVVVVAATGHLIGRLAERLGLSPRVAGAAAILYVVASAVGPGQDVLAANAEIFMLLPSVGALTILALVGRDSAPGRRLARTMGALAAGVCAGTASLYKYQAAVVLIPAAVMVWRSDGRRSRWVSLLALALGVSVPLIIVLAAYTGAGLLVELRFWAWTFPLRYAGALQVATVISNAVVGTLAWSGPLAALLFAAWRGIRYAGAAASPVMSGAQIVIAVWVVASVLGVASGGRFVLHYYLQLLPPVCLAAGVGAVHAIHSVRARRALAMGLALPLAGFWIASAADPRFRPEVARDTPVYEHIARVLGLQARPGDTLFVWGGSSQIYVLARMPIGTRFVFCNYQAGKMWGTPADLEGATDLDRYVVRETWPMLMADLSDRKPTWIVDAGEAGLDRWRGHGLGRYPQLAAVVRHEYAAVARVDGATVYRSRPHVTVEPR